MTVGIGIGILVFVVIGIVVLSKMKGKDMETAADMSASGIPTGHEQEYRDGIAPCECTIPVMFTLHTCRHCVHLKQFLDDNGVSYTMVYVDDFADPARKELMASLRKFNPRGSFPTLVLPNGKCVVGFRESLVRELLHIEA